MYRIVSRQKGAQGPLFGLLCREEPPPTTKAKMVKGKMPHSITFPGNQQHMGAGTTR